MRELAKIQQAAAYIRQHIEHPPQIGVVLGSGLGDFADHMHHTHTIPFSSIPHFPVSTVAGHAGELVIGEWAGKTVFAMKGRIHYYEGYTMQQVTFPIRIMRELGITDLLITNACGGMNPQFAPGQLMAITDHLNLTGTNPLIGENLAEYGPRFPDMSRAYTPEWVALAEKVAKQIGIPLQKGVYAGISGPYYLPPAELRMLRRLGGDAVGMSTVAEVIVAAHMGMRVLGISCITDMAIADELEPLSHEQVMAMADQAKPNFIRLLQAFIERI